MHRLYFEHVCQQQLLIPECRGLTQRHKRWFPVERVLEIDLRTPAPERHSWFCARCIGHRSVHE